MEYLIEFYHSLGDFSKHLIQGAWQDWWIIPLSIFLLILLSMLLSKSISQSSPQTKEWTLWAVLLRTVCILTVVMIATYCYTWANTSYYTREHAEMMHLLALGVLLVCMVYIVSRLAALYRRDRFRHISQPAYTRGEHAAFQLRSRRQFALLKRWLLLPLAGFLLCLLYYQKPDYLVAILLDNSSSMEEELALGKSVIAGTFRELDEHTDVIISSFDMQAGYPVADSILQASSHQQLSGSHYFATDLRQATSVLMATQTQGGTPLYETLWGQYLYASTQARNIAYDSKVLIIVTDGEDAYLSEGQGMASMLCSQSGFDSFWSEVGIINLGGDLSNTFYRKASACGYYIEEEGNAYYGYKSGIDTLVNPFKHNWYYPLALLVLCLLGLGVAALISPSRN